ncbi:MAG: helix-turn-helix transcriptional regulator [Opitutaceae bacterium]|nr:helix-turn-helix transcriptional regulator [Opitutaceae bacterium]
MHSAPSRLFPVSVRSAGHYRLPASGREVREPGNFFQVFWSVSGFGRFMVGSVSHPIKPGMAFYYAAGEPHDLLAGAEGWDYRWLTFDGARFGRIARDYGLARLQGAGACPVGVFEQLDLALADPTAEGELRASVLGYEILLRATAPRAEPAQAESPSGSAAAAKDWIDTHFTDARLNVAALAARLNVHRASLHRVFTRSYGVPPVQYLARLRLRLALELLADTHLPVADVAVRCGLPDLSYFSKLVSRHTGFSPRTYRQNHARTHG